MAAEMRSTNSHEMTRTQSLVSCSFVWFSGSHYYRLKPLKNEGGPIDDPPHTLRTLADLASRGYLALTWVTRAVKRDLCRAAALRCSAPFFTALSISETVVGSSELAACPSPLSRALRSFLIEVRSFVRLFRLIRRRRSLWRTRFSADL